MTNKTIEERVEEFESVFHDKIGSETAPDGTPNMYLIRNEEGEVEEGIDFGDEITEMQNWLTTTLTQLEAEKQQAVEEEIDTVLSDLDDQIRDRTSSQPQTFEYDGVYEGLTTALKIINDYAKTLTTEDNQK